jgi:hypothetical protein
MRFITVSDSPSNRAPSLPTIPASGFRCSLEARLWFVRKKYTWFVSAAFWGLIIHQSEPARQRARELVNTPEFAKHSGKERRWKPCSRN